MQCYKLQALINAALFIAFTFNHFQNTDFRSGEHSGQPLAVDTHELGHERLEVENLLGPDPHAVLEECRPVRHLVLELLVKSLHQLPHQRLHDDLAGDAVREQLVKHLSRSEQLGRGLFLENLPGQSLDEGLPVGQRSRGVGGDDAELQSQGLQHEHRLAQVPLAADRETQSHVSVDVEALLLGHGAEHGFDGVEGGRRDTDRKAAGPQWLDDLRGGVADEDDAALGGEPAARVMQLVEVTAVVTFPWYGEDLPVPAWTTDPPQ